MQSGYGNNGGYGGPGGYGAYDPGFYPGALGQFFGGMFGNSGAPYGAAGNAYGNYFRQGVGYQNPYLQAGQAGLGAYQAGLGQMANPSAYVNQLMQNYQQSPWAKFETQQGLGAANNAASASGMLGSTPQAQQNQQIAQGISSQDMQNYLQNAMGVNQQYLQGEGNLAGMGQNAANFAGNMYQNAGNYMGGTAYGQSAGQQQDWGNMLQGGLGMFGL